MCWWVDCIWDCSNSSRVPQELANTLHGVCPCALIIIPMIEVSGCKLLGCVTVVWGLFVFYWLPDSPMRAHCFSKEDRILIAERVRKNETGIQNKEFKAS